MNYTWGRVGCAISFCMFFPSGLGQVLRRRAAGRYASVARPGGRSVNIGQTIGRNVKARPSPRARPQADLRIAGVIPRQCRCGTVARLLYWGCNGREWWWARSIPHIVRIRRVSVIRRRSGRRQIFLGVWWYRNRPRSIGVDSVVPESTL